MKSNNITSIAIDSKNGKWFGTDSGLVHYDGENWQDYGILEISKKLPDYKINDLVIDSHPIRGDELWIATDSGATVVGSLYDAITSATPLKMNNSDLISDKVLTVFIDENNIRWFGTDKGLSRFLESEWQNFTTENSLSENYILSIGSSSEGVKYICTRGGGVSRLIDNGVDAITSASPYDYEWSGILSDTVYSVLVQKDGTQWFATDTGVNYHNSVSTKYDWWVYQSNVGLINDKTKTIAQDSSGLIWFGTEEGVSSISTAEEWKSYTTEDGLSGNDVRDISVDQEGHIWFATNNGVTEYVPNLTNMEFDQEIPTTFKLLNNYPNPFNPSTKISYIIDSSDMISINIYNITGELITNLINSHQSAGYHSINWDGMDSNKKILSGGVYFVVLSNSTGKISTKKIMMLK